MIAERAKPNHEHGLSEATGTLTVVAQLVHLARALREAAGALEALGAAIATQQRVQRAEALAELPRGVDSLKTSFTPDQPHLTQGYPPLWQEQRVTVGTGVAAFHLNRQEQTLRHWACYESGPLRPRRINGRLALAVADIRRVLGAET